MSRRLGAGAHGDGRSRQKWSVASLWPCPQPASLTILRRFNRLRGPMVSRKHPRFLGVILMYKLFLWAQRQVSPFPLLSLIW